MYQRFIPSYRTSADVSIDVMVDLDIRSLPMVRNTVGEACSDWRLWNAILRVAYLRFCATSVGAVRRGERASRLGVGAPEGSRR